MTSPICATCTECWIDSVKISYSVNSLEHQVSKLTSRKLSAAFYDVTTYEFESQCQSELKDFSISKTYKVNEVQVVMGLVMDENDPRGL